MLDVERCGPFAGRCDLPVTPAIKRLGYKISLIIINKTQKSLDFNRINSLAKDLTLALVKYGPCYKPLSFVRGDLIEPVGTLDFEQ